MSLVSLANAIELLNQDSVVALPTETVYGLAGKITSEQALSKIFSTKARPFYDPLIVHVKDLDQALPLGHWGLLSQKLAKEFWPGPLTLVVRKKENLIADLITNGGDTVAFRQPDHTLFKEILHQLDSPLAAPSANMFGKTSPTTAQHVVDEFSNQVPVLDGGPCKKGIESTVIEVEENKHLIKILRPGFIGSKEISVFLKKHSLKGSVTFTKQENSPGFLRNHYQPTSPLVIAEESSEPFEQARELMKKNISPVIQPWNLPNDPALAARQMYNDLRTFSLNKQPTFLIIRKEWLQVELWQSLIDRLNKAAHYFLTNKNKKWELEEKN